MRLSLGVMLAISSCPAFAQAAAEPAPSIQVVGVGTVSTRPDVANLVYWVTGEGKTADAASAALAAKQKAIADGLAGFLGREARLSSGEISVIETRSPECDGPGTYNGRPRLSEGVCAVSGYVASLQGMVRTGVVEKAATAAGLAARLGARDARVQSFQLGDLADAQRRATAAAISNAEAKAEAMAAGAGVRLGPLLSLNDQSSGSDLVVSGGFQSLASAPPPPPPPVAIEVSPRPIETQGRVFARYAIIR